MQFSAAGFCISAALHGASKVFIEE